jgi:cleavage and polyadenylation specificity factor subunit 3
LYLTTFLALGQTTFKGRVFMTHATKAIYMLLLTDFVKVSKVSVDDMLYDEQDIAQTMNKIEVLISPGCLAAGSIEFD